MNPRDFKYTWIALGIILVALASSKGGLSALMPLLRFALPFIVLVLIYRFIKGKVISSMKDMQERVQQDGPMRGPGMGQGSSTQQGKVIDLCPKCGKYMTGNHRC